MTDWKIFEITSKSDYSSWIRFYLDGYVRYDNGSEKHIDCSNSYPYYNWERGDDLKIDIDRTWYYSSGKTFDDTSIVKKISSSDSGALVRAQANYSSLQCSYSSLQSRNSNLQSEVYSLQSRISSLQSEISSLRSQNSAKDSQISILNSQLANTQSQLKNKEGELVTNKKGLEELRGSFNDLTMVSNNKSHELEKKDRKIRELKELLGKSKEEIIDYKLKAKEGRLETLIQKLEVDRGKIRELRNNYQQLIRVFANNSQDDIEEFEDKIESIKDELIDKGINIIDAQKLCSKCEKIANLKVEQDKLYKERFEARQEVVLYDKK